jgi:leucyl/phenylalanyl-tRNA--protein transferase
MRIGFTRRVARAEIGARHEATSEADGQDGHAVRPIEPTPSSWQLEPAPDDHPDDLWAVGADLEPGTLLAAYRLGLFPMPVGARLGWFSPARRAVVPLEPFTPSRSLRRAARRFEIRLDTAFAEVVEGCARPGDPQSWIDDSVATAYGRLHELGWAHSVEAWDDDGLAGGLYGVAIGGLFAAESMFHARTDASKAAFVALVELLRAAGTPERRVLDVQWLTPHLESLGAVEVSRAEYRQKLAAALPLRSPLEVRKAGRCRS